MFTELVFLATIRFIIAFEPQLAQPQCEGLIEPPSLSIEKPVESITAARGASLLLTCSFYASPQPSIAWYHRGKRIENHRAAHFETLLTPHQLGQSVVRSTFRIDCLDELTSGEYFCEASTQCSPPVVTHSKVTINPSLKGISCDSLRNQRPINSAPIIAQFTLTRIELPAGVAQLSCRARGFPIPSVTWMKINDDDTLESIDNIYSQMQLQNGDLLVLGDDSKISESFRCIAKNRFGSAHQDATVIYMTP